jgi:AraC family transcriptional regulator of adaptative response/methylated-DNA-[protein]-cysteine methyltransferase
MKALPPRHELERAYLAGDAAYNGVFFLAVRTTGIFCRPDCPARKPLPKNVEYYPTARAALFAGYRPCKRCRPLRQESQPDWAERLIADVERDPATRVREADLRARGVDPATVRRFFLKHYGMTFQAYARARRLTAALAGIREGRPMTDAMVESGYESESGFREAFGKTFGTTPASASAPDCLLLAWISSPLGPLAGV